MPYKIRKIFNNKCITSINFYISFFLTFLMFIVIILINYNIEKEINSGFTNISPNCAYFEEYLYPNDIEGLECIKNKYKNTNYESFSFSSKTRYTIDSGSKKNAGSAIYVDLNSNILKYCKCDYDITLFSDDTNGILLSDEMYSMLNISNNKVKVINNNYKSVETNVIGTFKNNKTYGDDIVLSLSLYNDLENDSTYKSRILFEISYTNNIDENLNNNLKTINPNIITRYNYVSYAMNEFSEIKQYFNVMLYSFYIIMCISSIIILNNYYNKNIKTDKIYNIYYRSNVKFYLNNIIKLINSFMINIVISSLISLIIYNVLEINISMFYSYLYILLSYFIICFIYTIIYSYFVCNNKKI